MSWAAVVSGKIREPTPPSRSLSTTTSTTTAFTTLTTSDPTPAAAKAAAAAATAAAAAAPTDHTTNPPSPPSPPSPSPPHPKSPTATTPASSPARPRPRKSGRRHKPHSATPPPSPAPTTPGAWHPKPGSSMWDDPRIVAIYRLWTAHISSFMAQPAPFFHFFVVNPQFRQSVFDAGLTFHPDTDPANPVLINLNSSRFGMAERISPLAPPARHDNRPPTPRSPATAPTPPIPASPGPDLSAPAIPLQSTLPLPPPHNSSPLPFPISNVSNFFDSAKAGEQILPNGDQLPHPADFYRNGLSGLNGANDMHNVDAFENGSAHETHGPLMLDDALLTHRFSDGVRIIDASDSESELLSEVDLSLTNGTRVRAPSPSPVSKADRDAHLHPAERRRAGRRRVVSRVLDIRIPSSPICKQLSDRAKAELVQQIEETFPRITPEPEAVQVRKELLARLRRIISAEWEGAGIDVYGSAGNGLGLRSADLDMSLYMPKEVAVRQARDPGVPDPPKVILARLATIMNESNISVLSKVLEARVPVIKMHDPESKLQVDVCVNNALAVRNTELLKAYVGLDERFRYVCILVKLWAKRRDLNDAYHGTLSSYAYTLLVIHYLQTLEPPVLPCLQQMMNGKRVSKGQELPEEMTDNGSSKLYNTYYDRTVTPESFQSENHTPVHELLLGFFRYYAYTFRYRTDLVSIRLGTKATRAIRGWDEQAVYREWESKQSQYKVAFDAAKVALEARRKADAEERRLREGAQADGMNNVQAVASVPNSKRDRIQFPRRPRLESKHLFCIEDPFDIDHDLSRGMEKGAVTVIRQEMMRVYELIAETGDFETACEEWM